MKMDVTPRLRGSRVSGSRAICPKSCYICIQRRQGNESDLLSVPRDTRFLLRKLHAVHSETVVSDSKLWLWSDWYRVPIRDGLTIDDIGRICAAYRVYNGPYWGMGSELGASGAGELGAKHRASSVRNAKYRGLGEVVRQTASEEMRALLASKLDAMCREVLGEGLPDSWVENVAFWVKELGTWEKGRLDRVIEDSDLDIARSQLAYRLLAEKGFIASNGSPPSKREVKEGIEGKIAPESCYRTYYPCYYAGYSSRNKVYEIRRTTVVRSNLCDCI